MNSAIKSKGFTLIELMIAITIIGVLVALALPSYNNYIRTSARADAQSQMLKIAGDLARWRAKNLSYTGFVPETGFATTTGSLASVANATIYIPAGSTLTNYRYQIVLLDGSRTAALNSTDIRAGQGWIMVAVPNTGNSRLKLASRLVLNSQGLRCLSDIADSEATMKTYIATTTKSDSQLCSSPSKPW